jgi:hypothetical protein
MASLMKDLGIDRLTLEDRIALMHELWNNIAAESGRPPLSDSLRRKLGCDRQFRQWQTRANGLAGASFSNRTCYGVRSRPSVVRIA